jgi:hypothetical protein
MIKKTILLLFLISCACLAQNTSVTGTVTDTGGQAWLNGSFTFKFLGPPQAIWQGGALPLQITGALTAAGAISATNVPDNGTISPVGTQWSITVCSATVPQSCSTSNVTITGAAQVLTLTPTDLTFTVPTIPTFAFNPITAYADDEITGGWVGFSYYNLTSQTSRVCSTGK